MLLSVESCQVKWLWFYSYSTSHSGVLLRWIFDSCYAFIYALNHQKNAKHGFLQSSSSLPVTSAMPGRRVFPTYFKLKIRMYDGNWNVNKIIPRNGASEKPRAPLRWNCSSTSDYLHHIWAWIAWLCCLWCAFYLGKCYSAVKLVLCHTNRALSEQVPSASWNM